MTTANNIKGQNINNDLITALYCRLSVEDIKDDKNNKRRNIDESNSISNQKQILLDYAKKHGYTNTMFFVDDGISGTSFDRSDFNRGWSPCGNRISYARRYLYIHSRKRKYLYG